MIQFTPYVPETIHGLPDWEIIQTKRGVNLSGKKTDNIRGIVFTEGTCAAFPQVNEFQVPAQTPLSRKLYEKVLEELVRRGEISTEEVRDSSGKIKKYDDRKLRVSNLDLLHPISDSVSLLEVQLGTSHFKAFREDQNRSPEECVALQQRGMTDLGDRWAYFQRNPGVAGLVLSESGTPYLGARTNEEAKGKLNSVAGHLRYRETLSEVNLMIDLFQELQDEIGVLPADVDTVKFVGAFGNPLRGDFDFTYLVHTQLPDSYFQQEGAWKERRRTKEHDVLIGLPNNHGVRLLLNEGKIQQYPIEGLRPAQIMYSTRGALMAHLNNQER